MHATNAMQCKRMTGALASWYCGSASLKFLEETPGEVSSALELAPGAGQANCALTGSAVILTVTDTLLVPVVLSVPVELSQFR